MKTKIILISFFSLLLLFSCATAKLERIETKVEEIPSHNVVSESAYESFLIQAVEEESEEVEEELPVLYSDGEFFDFKNGEVPVEDTAEKTTMESVEEETKEEVVATFTPSPRSDDSEKGERDINETIVYLILVVFLLISIFGLISLLARGRKRDDTRE